MLGIRWPMPATAPLFIASILAGVGGGGGVGCVSTSAAPTPPAERVLRKRVAGEATARIVAARAFSEHWTVSVKPGTGLEHPTTFTWGIGPSAVGTLTEDGASGEVLRLAGTLSTVEGERPTTISFAPADCVDDGDTHHAYRVTVEIAGIDVDAGCGDLAK